MDVRRAKRTKTESDEYKYSRVRKRNGEDNQSKSRNRHPIALQHQTKSTVKLEKTTFKVFNIKETEADSSFTETEKVLKLLLVEQEEMGFVGV